jgi:hypothetical protein
LDHRTIAQIERDLRSPAQRAQAAAELAALTLVDPSAAWPCLAKWGGGEDAQAREAVAAAVAHLLEQHFDHVAPALARTAAADDRFGNTVLPSCFRAIPKARFKQLQNHIRVALAAAGRGRGDDQPSIESILDEDDLDLFAIDLLDHLMSRDELSAPESVAFRILMLNVEVTNGGLEQYYLNAAGNDAPTLADALKAVGSSRQAAIVDQANALFGPGGPSTEMSERRTQISSFGPKAQKEWIRLTRAFSALREDDVARLRRYARRNRAAFGAA